MIMSSDARVTSQRFKITTPRLLLMMSSGQEQWPHHLAKDYFHIIPWMAGS